MFVLFSCQWDSFSIPCSVILCVCFLQDLDGSGMLRYTEFLASTIEAQGAIDERRLAEAFDRLDTDDSGFITKEALQEILGEGFPEAEIDKIIKESDLTKDGKISYMEFLAQWQDQKEAKRQDFVMDISTLRMRDSYHMTDSPSVETLSLDSDLNNEDVLSKVNFIQNKQTSERKASITESNASSKGVSPIIDAAYV
jgi:hypothetical protein